jgi:hypothetical protein
MPLKYHSYIGKLKDCPPSSCQPRILTAYRFVFIDPKHSQYSNNFLPGFLIKPNRRKISHSDDFVCDGYGLSFFDSLQNARLRFEEMLKKNPKLRDTLGTHIAEGQIDPSDGVTTKSNDDGHLTLHESDVADLPSKFTAIAGL